MKNLLHILVLVGVLMTFSNESKACHALALVNPLLNPIPGGVEVTASSNSVTCGCAPYWMDVEVRCMGEPFDGAPFNPGFHGPLANYPYFQSTQMTKPDCVEQQYPWVDIPFTGLCPGIQYQVRMRENHHGEVGPWTAPMTFTVPGTIDPLVGQVTSNNVNLCIGDCTTLDAEVTGGCGLAPIYEWSTGETTPSINVCPTQTTTYNVDITEQCSNLTITESITVFVVPTPIAGTATANPTTVCIGETTNLTLNNYDGNIQWQSAPNAGGPWTDVAGATTANETSPPINADICFRAEVSGCGPEDISNVVCVTVAPTPVLDVSDETICAGETTTLTSNVDLTGGNYTWTPTGQNTADLTNGSPAATTTSDLVFELNGCIVTESGTVTVNPQPTTLDLAGSTICDGDVATITATPDEAGGTYTWTPNVSNNNEANVSPGVGTNTYTVDYDLNGCTYSESIDIIVNPVPTVDIAEQEICNGEDATLTAVPDITGGDFLWAPNGEVTDNINVTPNATTNYSVTYTLDGCVANNDADVIVNSMPTADFIFTEVCEDIETPLTSNSAVPAPGVIQTREWDIGNDGNVEYYNANTSHDFNGWGNYDVNLRVVTDAGCEDDITQTIEVYPLAIVDFDATPLCLGNPTDFEDLTVVPNSGTIDTWDWNFDDGNTDNVQNPQNTYATAGVYDVNLEITTDNGCVTSLNKDIEIYDLPVADFDFENDCFYNDIEFSNTSSGNATNFEWDFDDGSNTNYEENPSNLYNSAGMYDVTLYISTDDGCDDEITQSITTYAQPNAEFSVDPTCFETTSEFVDESTVNPVDGDVITDWNWSFGDGNTSTQQNPTNQYAGENVYSTSLTVTTNHGCEDIYVYDAIVWPLPEVDFSPTNVCLEFDTQFEDQSTISNQFTNNTNVNWLWDFGDGNSSNQQNPSHSYMIDGVFTANLTVTSNNGCINDEDIDVTVHPKPEASFTGENLSGCSPLCFDLTSTSTVNNPSSFVDYEWSFSDGTLYSSSNPEFGDCFENNSGNTVNYGVELTVTTDQGCQDTHSEANYISVFHNPIANFNYSPEEIDILDPIIQLNNNSQYADTYDWYVSDWGSSTDFSPEIEFEPEPETYDITLITLTEEGCTDTAFGVVDVLDRLVFYVPNTFTPDKDDYNEVFKPIFTSGFDPMSYNLTIYNRWGEVLFESNNTDVGWNGTYGANSNRTVRDGTYLWKIVFKETGKDKRVVEMGHVNILR